MKHLAALQVEFVKEARKWEQLTPDEQRKYLKRHPKSKRKYTVQRQQGKSFEELLDDALSYLDSGVSKADTAYTLEREHKITSERAKDIVNKAKKLMKRRGDRFSLT